MADEGCVYENVLRDASSLSADIFVKLLNILMETSDQPNLSEARIRVAVERLFRAIVYGREAYVRHSSNLEAGIKDVVENRACEHGFRYKALVGYDAFWDEKRLRTLKDARRATPHRHLVDISIAPQLDGVKTEAKKEIKVFIK